MYGTVARMRLKPGAEAALTAEMDAMRVSGLPGIVRTYIYKMDNEKDIYYLATVFASKEAYVANAQSPEQHQRYLAMMKHLAAEPEWHDGEVVSAYP